MLQRPFEGGWILRLETAEEVASTITAFCEEQGIEGGILNAIGAVKWAEIGWYDPDKGDYASRVFEGGFEVVSMTGNVSRRSDGDLFVHTHVVLSGQDYSALAGHLFEAEVSATMEIYLWTLPDPVMRTPVEGSHL
jgi:hypothetical protein